MQLSKFRWQLSFVVISLFTLASCTNYGKKVTFPGHKGEVYYKGEGVTESDAKAVGKFLEEQKYFLTDDQTRSVQLTEKDKRIEARFVVNEKKMAAIKNADQSFEVIGARMSKDIFDGKPVDIIYTDDHFKDIKTIAFNKKVLEAANFMDELAAMNKSEINSNTLYFSKNISDENASAVADYLSTNGFFTASSTNDFIIEKTADNSVHIRAPFQTSYLNADGIQKVTEFAEKIKADLFPNNNMEFEILDEKMNTVKTLSY